jgi:uncharacterized CHY-type Zn-finger protein
MSIPKTTKFTLKRIVEGITNGTIPNNGFGEEVKRLTPEQKNRLVEMASNFENYGECLRNEESIVNSAKGLTELSELAEQYALNECGDAFQRNIVERDMKELKKRVMEHTKIAKECYARMQQLGVSYQDIGHILGRYYNLKKAKSMDQDYTSPGDSKVMNEGDHVCAWCKKTLTQNAINGKRDTHGICPECKSKFFGSGDTSKKEIPVSK